MAGADYKRCDVCGAKTFYDVDLNYVKGPWKSEAVPEGVGAWAVICRECFEKGVKIEIHNPNTEGHK